MHALPRTSAGRVQLLILVAIAAGILFLLAWCTYMPGRSFRGVSPPLRESELEARERLRTHVEELTVRIGDRNRQNEASLRDSIEYIREVWAAQGFDVHSQSYDVDDFTYENLEVELAGSNNDEGILIVGAHYDSVPGSPGADDNASGMAALLELSRRCALEFEDGRTGRTIRFVAFTNEEPPHFQRDTMGSLVYAKRCVTRGEKVEAMISLECVGYFDSRQETQEYPGALGLFYGDRADFIAFVGTMSSRPLVHEVIESFRNHAEIPSEGLAAPQSIPGIAWSDHWSFDEQGIQALMVTDTAFLRNPHYHEHSDTIATLDFEAMTRVLTGLEHVVRELVLPRE